MTPPQRPGKRLKTERNENSDGQTSAALTSPDPRPISLSEESGNADESQHVECNELPTQPELHPVTSDQRLMPSIISVEDKAITEDLPKVEETGLPETPTEAGNEDQTAEGQLARLRERALSSRRGAKRKSSEQMESETVASIINGHSEPKQEQNSSSMPPPPIPHGTGMETHEGLAFYLHAPSLPSRHTVLIPLSPKDKLLDCLSQRLVLEFPTIYVMQQAPKDTLPDGFITEEQFYKMSSKDLGGMPVIDSLIGQSDERVGTDERDLEEGEVDESRLLEVLGKDLKSVMGNS